jgi:hypothetical protein
MGWYSLPIMSEHYELGKKYALALEQLIALGTLRPTPTKVVPFGLKNAQHWIDLQGEGKVCLIPSS